jgi:hypothetical protein
METGFYHRERSSGVQQARANSPSPKIIRGLRFRVEQLESWRNADVMKM